MKKFYYKVLSLIFRRNFKSTPTNVILDQMKERRSLPLGRQEFEEWSDRIISGTLLPADSESMKFALSSMLLHLGPQEDHREDAYFIHSLRKSAVNQVAHSIMAEIRDNAKLRLAAVEEEKAKEEAIAKSAATSVPAVEATLARIQSMGLEKNKSSEATPSDEGEADEVLGNK